MPVFQRTRPPTARACDDATTGAAAFTRLYGDFFDPIYWYCRNRLGDATAAEDAASTVFTRALAAGPRYADPAPRSWLFGIAHNVLANWFRAARPTSPLETAFDVPDSGRQPDDAVVADEERDRLVSALSGPVAKSPSSPDRGLKSGLGPENPCRAKTGPRHSATRIPTDLATEPLSRCW